MDIDSANVDEKLKPILRFVKKLTLTPDQITQADIKPIYEAGWDERVLLDSIYLCSVVNSMNRFALGIGIYKKTLPKTSMRYLLSNLSPLIIPDNVTVLN